ncbi:hypothetical protein NKR23_g5376 [Pleurostoma richardsiae]|uniref:Uncharacterized protein n=1 Tax=Pleurostoma richardsiae TaxID=41990 RepID=A0AA38S2C4_9PEZI|nr:hypothetical protein NKR23_g5376 [Pleurostoma richardsiae]
MYARTNTLLGHIAILSWVVLAFGSPVADVVVRDLVTSDRERVPAPAGENYDFIEYFTGDITSKECIQLNPGALLVLNNNTLEKRSGSHSFSAYSAGSCSGGLLGSVSGFGCSNPNCFSWGGIARSTRLTQARTGNPYPTADLHLAASCSDGRQHHQGITSTSSCDTATSYGVPITSGWQSTELWFDC